LKVWRKLLGTRIVPCPYGCIAPGLLLPGERKSIEPMAARLAPENVRRMHQSLHHMVADAPWSDEALLDRVRILLARSLLRQFCACPFCGRRRL
jgi:SRSO17 transposase